MKTIKKYALQTNAAPNSGKMLTAYINSKRIYRAALARTLNRASKTTARYEKNGTIQTAVLWEICHALKHNFLADLAAQLPAAYTVSTPPDTTKDERIAQLEQQVALLQAERDVLLLAIKR